MTPTLPYRTGRGYRVLLSGIALAVAVFIGLVLMLRGGEQGIPLDDATVMLAQVWAMALAWYIGDRYRMLLSSPCRNLAPGYFAHNRILVGCLLSLLFAPALMLVIFAHTVLFGGLAALFTALFFAIGADPRCAGLAVLPVLVPFMEDRLHPWLAARGWLPLEPAWQWLIGATLLSGVILLIRHGLRYPARTQLDQLQAIAENQVAARSLNSAIIPGHDNWLSRQRYAWATRALARTTRGAGVRNKGRYLRFLLPFGGLDWVLGISWTVVPIAVMLLLGQILFQGPTILVGGLNLILSLAVTMVVALCVASLVSQWRDWLRLGVLTPGAAADPRQLALRLIVGQTARITGVSLATLWICWALIPTVSGAWAAASSFWLFFVAVLAMTCGLLVLAFSAAQSILKPFIMLLPILLAAIGGWLVASPAFIRKDAGAAVFDASWFLPLAAFLALATASGTVIWWLRRPLDFDRHGT